MTTITVNPLWLIGPKIVLNSACRVFLILFIKILIVGCFIQYLGVTSIIIIVIITQFLISLVDDVGSKIENKDVIIIRFYF